MRFANKKEEFVKMIETVALMISFGAIFLQIWVLITGLESYFQGKHDNLLPGVILSGMALAACGFGVLLTRVNFFKGMTEGLTNSYQRNKS